MIRWEDVSENHNLQMIPLDESIFFLDLVPLVNWISVVSKSWVRTMYVHKAGSVYNKCLMVFI